ncbi:hypothetical protein ACFX2I_002149 [Malus domestica]
MFGNGRCEAMRIAGKKRLCHIRSTIHKKVWIAADDIVLVGLHDYQDDKAYAIPKSMPDEARRLNEGIAAGVLDEDENEGGADDYVGLEDKGIDNIQRFSDQNSIYLPDVIFYRY